MGTRSLKKMQQPSGVQSLLESYIAGANILPQGCHRIPDRGLVPRELREVVSRAIGQRRVWSCWVNNLRAWLFTAEMFLPASPERREPVLQVSLYGEDGTLRDSGAWSTHHDTVSLVKAPLSALL